MLLVNVVVDKMSRKMCSNKYKGDLPHVRISQLLTRQKCKQAAQLAVMLPATTHAQLCCGKCQDHDLNRKHKIRLDAVQPTRSLHKPTIPKVMYKHAKQQQQQQQSL